jgi:hypothetical protein
MQENVVMKPRREEIIILSMVAAIGLIPVVGWVVGATPAGLQPVIGAAMILVALVELVRGRRS